MNEPHDTPDSSVYYHGDDANDPFVDDPNRQGVEDDYYSCPMCDCAFALEIGCRCSCHSQRRHH